MNSSNPLHIGEKIRQIRVAKGLSQENLAHASGKSKSLISRLERGESEFDDMTLAAIKEYLGIINAPLLEHELEIYKARLWSYNDLVHSKRHSEAEEMKDTMSIILDLPYERDFIIMYKMISARLLHYDDIAAIETYINEVEPLLDGACDDAVYLYRLAKGRFCDVTGDYKAALTHYLRALEYMDDMQKSYPILVYSVARNYSLYGRPILAKLYFERAKKEYTGDRTHEFMYAVDNAIGFCCAKLGELDRAHKLFESSLFQAKSVNDKRWTGLTLYNISLVYYQKKDYKTSLKYVEESLEYLVDEVNQYIEAIVAKARCHKKSRYYCRHTTRYLQRYDLWPSPERMIFWPQR